MRGVLELRRYSRKGGRQAHNPIRTRCLTLRIEECEEGDAIALSILHTIVIVGLCSARRNSLEILSLKKFPDWTHLEIRR